MKLNLLISGNQVRFSNPGEGFDIAVSHGESFMVLHLTPWEQLPAFVSAVSDYSHNNGLNEVSDEGLAMMQISFTDALASVDKEIQYRKNHKV